MPAKVVGAGQLIERVAFDRREPLDDGYGNEIAGDWKEVFQDRAGYVYKPGSETIMAGRLQNRAPMIVQVRISSATRSIGTDWRMRDIRSGVAYNIRDIHAETRGRLDILVESNVNPG
jgi:head-tail adaptor